jgi:hypothetical protein
VLLANVLGLQGNKVAAQTALAEAAQGFGDTERLIGIYRTLHLTRFERAEDAAAMKAGLKAAGVEV